jgi:hypothetical protein
VTDTTAPLAAICCDKTLPISRKIKQLRGIVAFLRDTPHIRGSRDAVTPCRKRAACNLREVDFPTAVAYW